MLIYVLNLILESFLSNLLYHHNGHCSESCLGALYKYNFIIDTTCIIICNLSRNESESRRGSTGKRGHRGYRTFSFVCFSYPHASVSCFALDI